MKWIRHRFFIVVLTVLVFLVGLSLHLTRLALYGEDWATYPTNRHVFKSGMLNKAGDITDRNGTVLATTKNGERIYNQNKDIRMSTVHTVGDLKGFVSTGVQSAYLKELCGWDIINGTYNISGRGNNIELTLDSNLCTKALKQLGSYSGAFGIYNYQTGEIICMVSTPTFDPHSATAPAGDGVYVNRFVSGVYAPGSIFKLVTSLSALENINNAENLQFSCNHGTTIMNEWLSCMGNHKNIKLGDALTHSCNAFFAQTALELGRNKLTKTAEEVGFNKTLKMGKVECGQSVYKVKNSNDIDFGWSGIGQHNDLVNPYHFLSFMGGIANSGESVSPFVVRKITSSEGVKIKGAKISKTKMMSERDAAELTQMMRNNVRKNYGDHYFGGLEVCGKTGTAEVGDKATPHSWFTGFINDSNKPYAFAVVVENAGSGNGVALRIASNMLKNIV